MNRSIPVLAFFTFLAIWPYISTAQKAEAVKMIQVVADKKVDVFIGDKFFTSFRYPDTLEKPFLYPVHSAGGKVVTRGFPLDPVPHDPNDHPHHIGIWLNYENLNGLDFWNNSYAIPAARKHLYGWIKTDRVSAENKGTTGILNYRANWTNQKNEVQVIENTRMAFSGVGKTRIIDRTTTFTAVIDALFTDVKDGFLGIRLAHALQIPTDKDQKFTDDKGIVTIVKGGTDTIANGNYLSSDGKRGDEVWSTRGRWCKVFGKMGNDSVSVVIIDHPMNTNYPTFWHARGYGLFAANPLGEKVFTNGKSEKNLALKKGESVSFRYRIVVDEDVSSLSPARINQLADAFAKTK
ncbi:MAG: PmoA family protein [Ferruginibacter sp.]|nr:PmoA family protein [Ferruginibacter sp.]